MSREVRVRQIPVRFEDGKWQTEPQSVVLVDSAAWLMVRRVDSPHAAPFVISRKEWERLPRE